MLCACSPCRSSLTSTGTSTFDTKEALEYGIIDQVVRPLRTQTLGV